MGAEPGLEEALAQLQAGRVVAAATETFFGLLADALNPDALDLLFRLKAGEQAKPIGLIASSWNDCFRVVQAMPGVARRLAQHFWPGPLTIAVPALSQLDPRLQSDGRVAIRVPADCPARVLAARSGLVLTATSANPAGLAPATSAAEARQYFAREIADGSLLVLPGEAPGGLPSTVLVFHGERARVGREGAISVTQLLEREPGLDLEL